jgi:hypothetical protein
MLDMEFDHIDIKTAFLYGLIDRIIYMKQPPGCAIKGKEHLVCKLKKSLYGLRQAGRIFNHHLHQFIISLGFTQSKCDECLYFKMLPDGTAVYVLCYVDDLLCASKSKDALATLKTALRDKFSIVDRGTISCYLNIEVRRDRAARKLWLGQSSYIRDTLERFRMSDCNPTPTPEHPCKHNRLTKDMCPSNDEERQYMSGKPFRELVGSLNYISTKTRPDIMHALQQVSQFMSNPGKAHWTALLRILRYLKGTMDLGITFDSQNDLLKGYFGEAPSAACFTDSDWANDLDKRKSVGGYAFILYGGIIDYQCRKTRQTAMSTQEAEWYAACNATKAGKYLRNLFQELGLMGNEPITLLEDNNGCINFAHKSVNTSAMRHIDLRYHFVRDYLQRGIIHFDRVPSKDNIADMFTKALQPEPFMRLRQQMRLLTKL